jgi:hypothetical protein
MLVTCICKCMSLYQYFSTDQDKCKTKNGFNLIRFNCLFYHEALFGFGSFFFLRKGNAFKKTTDTAHTRHQKLETTRHTAVLEKEQKGPNKKKK